MASIIIVSLTPVIRDLVHLLVTLAGHAPVSTAEWANERRVDGPQGEVLLLDASLPPLARDEWVCRAADLHAVVVYFASALSEPELRILAEQRNALFYALPNGPRLLSRVLDGALSRRADEAWQADTAEAPGRGAFHSPQALAAELLVTKARRVIQHTSAMRHANRELRDRRDELATELLGRREMLHDTVVQCATALRRSGTSLEGTMLLTRHALARAAPLQSSDTLAPTTDIDRWVLEAFRAG